MTTDELLFGALPYAVILLAVVVTIVRWRMYQFSVSSLSSQLLESRKLYWGSIPFHWGIVGILAFHLLALAIPSGVDTWNSDRVRLYALEITGFALATWALVGLIVLIYRRLSTARVRVVTTPMDGVVLLILAFQIVTGIWVATMYRFGSQWGTAVAVPYVRSLITFDPDTALIAPMPLAFKLHVLGFFAFIAVFPFTRLVHIITLPLQYLVRPWQKVVRNRPTPAVYNAAAEKPLERVR